MRDSRRLIGFGLVLAAALGAGYGIGVATGPVGAGPGDSTVVETGGAAMSGSHS